MFGKNILIAAVASIYKVGITLDRNLFLRPHIKCWRTKLNVLLVSFGVLFQRAPHLHNHTIS